MMRLLPFEYAVRNLGRSPRRLVASVLGGALVVVLVLAAAAFVRGMEKSLLFAAESDNVILLGAGSEDSLERSEINPAAASLLAATVDGLRSRLGVVYSSPEVHLMTVVKTSRDAVSDYQAVIRGVTPTAFLVYPHVQITEGRAPRPGHNEMMVGRLVATRLGARPEDLAPGKALWFDNRPWTITGRFDAPGTVMNAEIWTPLNDLMVATRRTTISCVVASLGTAEFADVDAFCKQRLDLELVAIRERDYYSKLLKFFGPIRMMVWATAILVALGGLFGGLNTMYAAFASRVRELGALQTLGFRRLAIVVSFLQESLLTMSFGALLAAVVGLAFLNGIAVRFSLGAFGLVVDAPVLLTALGVGLALGVVGALPPAWRCLSMPITAALRAA